MTIDFEPGVRDDVRLMDFAVEASSILRHEIGSHDQGIHVEWRAGTVPAARLTLMLTVAAPGAEPAAEAPAAGPGGHGEMGFSERELDIRGNELNAKLLARLRDCWGGLIRDSRRW